MKTVNILGAAAMCVSLSGCYTAQVSNYCRQYVVACMAATSIVALGVVVLGTTLLRAGQHHGNYGYHHYSDSRLKEDIRHVMTLPQGVKVYSFRYKGDDRTFTGLMAQDLLEDERFRGAVGTDASGFYFVDYEALGLEVRGADQMLRAGMQAVARAAS